MTNDLTLSRGVVLKLIAELDQNQSWVDLQSKDIPAEIVNYVAGRLGEEKVDVVRKELGMFSPQDPRWRKILLSIRAGKRIDATGIFLRWLERNEEIGDKVAKIANEVLDEQRPYSKLLMEAIQTMSALQMNTIKIGKDLGVFADPNANTGQGGQQGVTIVVQTHVPHPEPKDIVSHQNEQVNKNKKLLDKHKPEESK